MYIFEVFFFFFFDEKHLFNFNFIVFFSILFIMNVSLEQESENFIAKIFKIKIYYLHIFKYAIQVGIGTLLSRKSF
jgi:hypothetical protein